MAVRQPIIPVTKAVPGTAKLMRRIQQRWEAGSRLTGPQTELETRTPIAGV